MITYIYIGLCILVFLYIQFVSKDEKLLTAMRLGAFYPPQVRDKHEYYRFITCNFIHIEPMHLFFNMYALYYLGPFFEQLLGPGPYLVLILASMLGSSLMCYSASEISDKYDQTITFGASGVVYGFFGAIIALGLVKGGGYYDLLMEFMFVIVINIAYTFMNKTVSKTGHLGGLIGGAFVIIVMIAASIL